MPTTFHRANPSIASVDFSKKLFNMKPKSILQNLFALLVVLCNVLEINAQAHGFEKMKAEKDSFAQRFRHWAVDAKSNWEQIVMTRDFVADIERFSSNGIDPAMWVNASFLHNADTTYSDPKSVYFLMKEKNLKFGTTFPMFQLDGDSINLDVKIGYKILTKCQSIALIFNMIGSGATTLKADTISLPSSNEWTEQNVSLSLPRGISLDVLLNVVAQDSVHTIFTLAPIEVSSGGKPLTWDVDADKYAQIPASAIQSFDDLLASPLMDKKILALGETIHGSQNINDLVFSLIKERILHHNCRLVFIELPTELTLSMNRYVKNDPHYSLDSISALYGSNSLIHFEPFIQWLRDYNAAHNNEVTFAGVDESLSRNDAFQLLFEFLKPLNSDYALDSLCYDLAFLIDSVSCDYPIVNERLTADEMAQLQSCLDVYSYKQNDFQDADRDSLMALRIQKFCDAYLGENETATFYSHLLHAIYKPENSGFLLSDLSAGNYLKERHKDDYACLAISATQGERTCSTYMAYITEALPPAPESSFEHLIISKTDDKPIFISVDNLKQGDIHQIRISGRYQSDCQFYNVEPQLFMDGLVVLKNSTALNFDRKSYQQLKKESVKRFFSNMLEMRERVKGKMQ